jgi:acetyl-CoA carboxylase biotin carboxylase subunit
LVTGLDLVHWQLRIAAGEPLTLQQHQVRWRGAAIECRIYAEDPDNQFFPSPGKITSLSAPSGPGIRFDSGVYPGWTVSIDYDPLLAKLAAWADTRDQAIERMLRALDEISVAGIKTNIAFFRRILNDSQLRAGNLHTGFIDEFLQREPAAAPVCSDLETVAMLVSLEMSREAASEPNIDPASQREKPSKWRSEGRGTLLR